MSALGDADTDKFLDRSSTLLISTIGGVNEHPALYVCSTMFVLLLPLSAVR